MKQVLRYYTPLCLCLCLPLTNVLDWLAKFNHCKKGISFNSTPTPKKAQTKKHPQNPTKQINKPTNKTLHNCIARSTVKNRHKGVRFIPDRRYTKLEICACTPRKTPIWRPYGSIYKLLELLFSSSRKVYFASGKAMQQTLSSSLSDLLIWNKVI